MALNPTASLIKLPKLFIIQMFFVFKFKKSTKIGFIIGICLPIYYAPNRLRQLDQVQFITMS